MPSGDFLQNVPRAPPNKEEPQFIFLSDTLFDEVANAGKYSLTPSEYKNTVISTFIKTFRLQNGTDIYPSARLIFPAWSGRKYFLKEVALGHLVIKMFDISKDSDDWHKLKNINITRQPGFRHAHDAVYINDIPLVISGVIGNARPTRTKWTQFSVGEVNDVLDELEVDQKRQIDLLRPLFEEASLSEVRWIIHIILKKKILVNKEMVFMNTWHPDGYELFEVCNSLQKTFDYLQDANIRLDKHQLEVHAMLKFRPQLAEKLTINYNNLVTRVTKMYQLDQGWEDKMDELGVRNAFYIEEKMDGDRMLLHKIGDKFKFFSRRLKDYSFLYGENYSSGSLAPHLVNAFSDDNKEVILDGEMVVWDYDRKVILPFGTLKSSGIQEQKRVFDTNDAYKTINSWPYFLVFDILRWGNVDLRRFPLFIRRLFLLKVIQPVPHRLEVMPVTVGRTKDDIEAAMREVITKRGEGVMIKHVQSRYELNVRSKHWFKVKPEYLENFGDNMDMVIIGKEDQSKPSYMCGLLNRTTGQWLSFCSVANGFSSDEYRHLETRLYGKWRDLKKDPPDESLIKFGKRKPHKWINPEHSVVIEVRGRDVNLSEESSYAVGSTLHNQWFRQFRDDKSWETADNLADWYDKRSRQILGASQEATKKRRIRDLGSFEGPRKKRWSPSDRANHGIFAAFDFVILSTKEIEKDQLEQLILSNGGLIKLQFDRNSERQTVILADVMVPVAKTLFETNKLDLIRPQWVKYCVEYQRLLQLEPALVFRSHHQFIGNDPGNDSYLVPVDIKDMQLRDIKPEPYDDEDLQAPALAYLFRRSKFFLVFDDEVNEFIFSQRIRMYGGAVVGSFSEATYVVGEDVSVKARIDSISRQIAMSYTLGSKVAHVVVAKFVTDCIASKSLVDPQDYIYI